MWDDFTIGERDRNTSATCIAGYGGLSQSLSHYWWRSKDLCLGGRIDKNTKVGLSITQMLAEHTSHETLEAFIVQRGLAAMSSLAAKDFLARYYHAAYQAGRHDKAREICRCLGVECQPF